jgi:hypothetical protein
VTTDAERFWRKVDRDGATIPGMTSRCWEWTAALDDRGKPRFKYEGVSTLANRARFALEGVPIGPEDCVVSLCRNRRCVRPEHHVLGTQEDARLLGTGGPICPGYQAIARRHYTSAEADVNEVALFLGVSRQVAEAVLAEGYVT